MNGVQLAFRWDTVTPTRIPKSKSHKITRTTYNTHYRRALTQQSQPDWRIRQRQQRTIGPVSSSLLHSPG
jgi:hypothetical protein